jgi:hypothetical protein
VRAETQAAPYGKAQEEGETMNANVKHAAMIAAAAQDVNDELTVLATALAGMTLPPHDPLRARVLEALAATQRLAWKTTGMLNYAARNGARPCAAKLEDFYAA